MWPRVASPVTPSPACLQQPDGRGPDDALGMHQPNRIYRRQDLPPVYMLDAGAIAGGPEHITIATRPSAQAMRLLGDKISSKRLAEQYEVPIYNVEVASLTCPNLSKLVGL